jgi:hypothetical protein
MNKSYSKIRHIQEVNQRLEKRLMSEQTQTTVVQTGENPGVKTKTTPPMSNPTLPIPTDERLHMITKRLKMMMETPYSSTERLLIG